MASPAAVGAGRDLDLDVAALVAGEHAAELGAALPLARGRVLGRAAEVALALGAAELDAERVLVARRLGHRDQPGRAVSPALAPDALARVVPGRRRQCRHGQVRLTRRLGQRPDRRALVVVGRRSPDHDAAEAQLVGEVHLSLDRFIVVVRDPLVRVPSHHLDPGLLVVHHIRARVDNLLDLGEHQTAGRRRALARVAAR